MVYYVAEYQLVLVSIRLSVRLSVCPSVRPSVSTITRERLDRFGSNLVCRFLGSRGGTLLILSEIGQPPGVGVRGEEFFCTVTYGMCGLIREHIRWASIISKIFGGATIPPGVAARGKHFLHRSIWHVWAHSRAYQMGVNFQQ